MSTIQAFPRTPRSRLLGSLAAVILGSVNGLSGASAHAGQASPQSCPLPDELAAVALTFLGQTCTKTVLTTAQTFYRYYSSDSNRIGRYLTTDNFTESNQVIRGLALNQAWGNQARRQLSVTLPAGTTVYQGFVAPQSPSACYPGGAQQTFVADTQDPKIVWKDGPQLVVSQPFVCLVLTSQ